MGNKTWAKLRVGITGESEVDGEPHGKRMGPVGMMVFVWLLARCSKEGEVMLETAKISCWAGVSEVTVRRYVKRLERGGYIEVTGPRNGHDRSAKIMNLEQFGSETGDRSEVPGSKASDRTDANGSVTSDRRSKAGDRRSNTSDRTTYEDVRLKDVDIDTPHSPPGGQALPPVAAAATDASLLTPGLPADLTREVDDRTAGQLPHAEWSKIHTAYRDHPCPECVRKVLELNRDSNGSEIRRWDRFFRQAYLDQIGKHKAEQKQPKGAERRKSRKMTPDEYLAEKLRRQA